METVEETILIGKEPFRIRHAADPDALLHAMLELPDDHPAIRDEQIPYWAELWPSAIGLGDFIQENRKLFAQQTVLEIGCGLGLPGIVAGRFAEKVILSDYLPEPLEVADINWRLNNSGEPATMLLDWRTDTPSSPADILIASDVAYERRMFDPLIHSFERLVASDGTVIISEPDRHFARTFFKRFTEQGWQVEKNARKVRRKGIDYNVNIHLLRK